ncbi:MAG: acyl-ACP--UDP-N-acetylglucosamine O-acyltransferase [bacterium]
MTATTDGASKDVTGRSRADQVAGIHPRAMVDPGAELGQGVEIGPNTIVGPDVVIGDRTRIGACCLVEGWTTIGKDCRIYHSAVVGGEPQDIKYHGERTFLKIGDGNIIREFVTIHRATGEGSETRIGDRNFIMAYAHVAHNCTVGSGAVLANAVNMAGHVSVDDYATIGGVTAIHQFVRIGKHSLIGGGSRIPMDVAPYVKVAGYPARVNGLNVIGLQRHGVAPETRRLLKEAYRLLFRSNLNVSQAIERIRLELEPVPEIVYLVAFVEGSARGVTL